MWPMASLSPADLTNNMAPRDMEKKAIISVIKDIGIDVSEQDKVSCQNGTRQHLISPTTTCWPQGPGLKGEHLQQCLPPQPLQPY